MDPISPARGQITCLSVPCGYQSSGWHLANSYFSCLARASISKYFKRVPDGQGSLEQSQGPSGVGTGESGLVFY